MKPATAPRNEPQPPTRGKTPGGGAALAKSFRESETAPRHYLGLVEHSIDVAAVAEALAALPVVRRRLEALAGRALTGADMARFGFFAGLHDAGKANSGFRARLRGEKPDAGHIGPLWAVLCGDAAPPALRKRLRKALRRRDWKGWFACARGETAWWNAVLAHHGSLPNPGAPPDPRLWEERAGYAPLAALAGTAAALKAMFPAAFDAAGAQAMPAAPPFMHAVAGIVTLADWLGSDRTVFRFPFEGAPAGAARAAWARTAARDMLRRRWLDPEVARRAAKEVPLVFARLFPNLPAPRPAQAELLAAPLPRPGQIVTLEAETGSGKTEAALLHFLRLFREGEVDGLYFALPTRAAAVQIHGRIRKILRAWLGGGAPPVALAVPGYLRVDSDEGRALPDGKGVLWPDAADRDRAWAAERPKRYLAGAVMVGTVDQLMLGALRVKHAQLRSGPMLRLLLVVDEVHASDACMTEILRNALAQHVAAGGHALLMSATLGALARQRFMAPGGRVERAAAPSLERASALPWPAIQRAGGDLRPLRPDGREKRVRVKLRDPDDIDALLRRIAHAAQAGAAVLFIRNTVRDAREAFRRLEELGAPLLRCAGVAAPHHGRYAPEDRKRLDEALESAFDGKERAGVVAVTTQTAEQSLDICADFLVTDIAPGDVLLQRIGRLHRHARRRPRGFEAPAAEVLAPEAKRLASFVNAQGEIRGSAPLGLGRVYRNIVGALATRKWLAERGAVRAPADNRALTEAAVHDESLCALAKELGPPWPAAHLQAATGIGLSEGALARANLIDWSASLADNNPDGDERIRTRLGLDDRRVDLPEPLPGPFGERIRAFSLPGWMARGLPADAEPTDIAAANGEIRFRLAGRAWRYDRLGLAPERPER